MRVILLLTVLGIAAIFIISGCISSNPEDICPSQKGSVLCGYCNQDASASDNPNAGQCRYCPSGSTCSYTDVCGELKCIKSGDGTNDGGNGGGGTQQLCSPGKCYSGGYCCPRDTPYYCNEYCYDSVGANSNGCYTLKSTCY